ncbi:acyltransferase family protein [Paraburkholderia sp. EG285A]|uniref:acyltransferase family protein n=1 Tax=Paraburkholderia sp. EG285A TaxID=3237009 RepID=UPI0034D244D2
MNDKERLHELDSLRALAAIGVIGWHYTGHFRASPLPQLMAPFYHHGLLLVDFFFVLSGFVLSRTYWTAERSGLFAQNFRDRIARLYPLHFTMLLVVAALQWYLAHQLASVPFIYTFNDKRDFVLHLFLLNRTGLERGFSFNAPAWSISTEFIINTIFLLAIVFSRRVATIILSIIFAIGLAVVLRNGLISNATMAGIDNDIFRTIVGFFVGVALHRFHAKFIAPHGLREGFSTLLSIVGMSAFLYYCTNGANYQRLDLVVAVLCFPAIIIGAIHGSAAKRVLNFPILTYLGTISYSIYLVHYPLQLAIHVVSVATGIIIPYGNPLFLVGFLLLVIATASLTYAVIEIPGKRFLKHKLGGSRSSAQVV